MHTYFPSFQPAAVATTVCPVCGCPFGPAAVTLDCLHSVCQGCLCLAREFLKSRSFNPVKEQSDEEFFMCPFCHEATQFREEEEDCYEKKKKGNSLDSSLSSSVHLCRDSLRRAIVDTELLKFHQDHHQVHFLLERLCVLRQCEADVEFLSLTMAKKNDCDIYNGIEKRMATIGRVLKRLGTLENRETNTGLSENSLPPAMCCLELSGQPFEKVLCEVPFVLLDSKRRKRNDIATEELSVSVSVNHLPCGHTRLLAPNAHAQRRLGHFPSWWALQFMPPVAGTATLRLSWRGRDLEVQPSQFQVRPLTLGGSNNKSLQTVSC